MFILLFCFMCWMCAWLIAVNAKISLHASNSEGMNYLPDWLINESLWCVAICHWMRSLLFPIARMLAFFHFNHQPGGWQCQLNANPWDASNQDIANVVLGRWKSRKFYVGDIILVFY
jgi:hypothetical protein